MTETVSGPSLADVALADYRANMERELRRAGERRERLDSEQHDRAKALWARAFPGYHWPGSWGEVRPIPNQLRIELTVDGLDFVITLSDRDNAANDYLYLVRTCDRCNNPCEIRIGHYNASDAMRDLGRALADDDPHGDRRCPALPKLEAPDDPPAAYVAPFQTTGQRLLELLGEYVREQQTVEG